jgi:hypothetical protein
MKNRNIKEMVENMIADENPGSMTRCMCCGELIDDDHLGDTVIWYDDWLHIAWVCSKCDKSLQAQGESQLAFHLAIIKRAESKLNVVKS